MKRFCNLIAIGFIGGLALGVPRASADLEVSASFRISTAVDFYEPLDPYGVWVEIGSYGRCWRPQRVAVDWRPYCDGHWVWTDCGWYWESDEPWAWACYHYGRWIYDPTYAWLWVPGIEWAPAWVSWRFGGGYCGWAPLAPSGFEFSVRTGLPSPFVFVEVSRFHERQRPSTVIVNNTTIINRTTVINNVRQETRNIEGIGSRRVVVNEGPGLAPIQKATDNRIRRMPVREAFAQTPVPAQVRERRSGSDQQRRTSPELGRSSRPAPTTPGVAPRTEPAPAQSRDNRQPRLTQPAPAQRAPQPDVRSTFPERDRFKDRRTPNLSEDRVRAPASTRPESQPQVTPRSPERPVERAPQRRPDEGVRSSPAPAQPERGVRPVTPDRPMRRPEEAGRTSSLPPVTAPPQVQRPQPERGQPQRPEVARPQQRPPQTQPGDRGQPHREEKRAPEPREKNKREHQGNEPKAD